MEYIGLIRNAKYIKYKMALLQLGLSQRELANILNLSESTISMVFAGYRKNTQIENWMKKNAYELFKREYNK